MSKPNLTRLSKFLALMLRHKAARFGLELDADGFTAIDAVWQQIEARFPGQYTYDDLLAVVEGDQQGKKRYEIRGERIRAMYGHGKVTSIDYPQVEPPELLYHGTSQEALASIRKGGLKTMRRQYVHLGTSLEEALSVGRRHSQNTVILRIRAMEAHRAGVVFYSPDAEHFLTRDLPPAFIDFPDE